MKKSQAQIKRDIDAWTLEYCMNETLDAYMRPVYGNSAWSRVIRFLISKDFTPAEIIAILRSKHMRWADDSAENNRSRSKNFVRYFEDPMNEQSFDREGMYYLLSGRRR